MLSRTAMNVYPCFMVFFIASSIIIVLHLNLLKVRLLAISRLAGTTKLVSQIAQLVIIRVQRSYDYHTLLQTQFPNQCAETAVGSVKVQCVNQAVILRSTGMAKLVSRITELGMARFRPKVTIGWYMLVPTNKMREQ